MNPERKKRVANEPFRRIKAENVTFADDRLRDNSFQARVSRVAVLLSGPRVEVFAVQPAGAGDYGARASADLIVTRGKGFTKEKNKKKRCARLALSAR